MWPTISLIAGLSTALFLWLWRRSEGKRARYLVTIGELGQSNEQLQQTAKDLNKRITQIIERTDKAMREKRRAAKRCSADFDALALAGQNDPAVVDRLARDLEQLFALSEAETTVSGNER